MVIVVVLVAMGVRVVVKVTYVGLILWPSDVKSRLIRKDPDARKD